MVRKNEELKKIVVYGISTIHNYGKKRDIWDNLLNKSPASV